MVFILLSKEQMTHCDVIVTRKKSFHNNDIHTYRIIYLYKGIETVPELEVNRDSDCGRHTMLNRT